MGAHSNGRRALAAFFGLSVGVVMLFGLVALVALRPVDSLAWVQVPDLAADLRLDAGLQTKPLKNAVVAEALRDQARDGITAGTLAVPPTLALVAPPAVAMRVPPATRPVTPPTPGPQLPALPASLPAGGRTRGFATPDLRRLRSSAAEPLQTASDPISSRLPAAIQRSYSSFCEDAINSGTRRAVDPERRRKAGESRWRG